MARQTKYLLCKCKDLCLKPQTYVKLCQDLISLIPVLLQEVGGRGQNLLTVIDSWYAEWQTAKRYSVSRWRHLTLTVVFWLLNLTPLCTHDIVAYTPLCLYTYKHTHRVFILFFIDYILLQHMHAWLLGRPEEGFGSVGLPVRAEN